MEAHRINLGCVSDVRPLNDLDIVVESFASIPAALGKKFLARHIHPQAPKGKILIQFVDADERLRIDVFRAYGATMVRSQPATFGEIMIQLVSLEDLAARTTSLLMDIEQGATVARKHAEDFRFLVQATHFDRVEPAWQDHRKLNHPSTFKEASNRVRSLVEAHSNLLVVPEYSRNVNAICPTCEETGSFRLSSAREIMSVLGYC